MQVVHPTLLSAVGLLPLIAAVAHSWSIAGSAVPAVASPPLSPARTSTTT